MRNGQIPVMAGLALGLLLSPNWWKTAEAGAWPRDEGEVFLSFGGNIALFGEAVRPVHYDPTVYVEYGLTPQVTLGFDGHTADAGAALSGFAFLRLAIAPDTGAASGVMAISGAVGVTQVPDGEVLPTGRIGLHWGMGLAKGWIAVDATALQTFEGTLPQTKVDASWGYRFADRWTGVLSAQAGTGLDGDFYAKVAPSIIYSLSDRISLRVGSVHALTGDEGTGLTVETWWTF
jgi:hypothetical protein